MHRNYENAKCMLVHDAELINFEWRDDGSPLVALLFSAWLTRGWTAAELFAARKGKVMVLFKSQDSSALVAKDLDDDILSYVRPPFGPVKNLGKESVIFTRPGHFSAAHAIE
jgi:hypothetical protein